MEIVKRSAFGWPASGGAAANPRKGLVIHYDGSNQGLAGKPHSACVTYWKNARRFHMGPSRGWADIGYSYFACPHGRVLEGRGLNREQAAQPGGNRDYYSVTLGSGPSENPTDAQIDAVRELRAYLMGRGVAGTVRGHRDFFATACPGDRLYRLVKDGTFTQAPEDDMPLSKADIDAIATAVWERDNCPAPSRSTTVKTNPTWAHENVIRELYDRVVEGNAVLAKLAEAGTTDIDEAEVARLVLATLTPETIAAAIPETLAADVADELAARLEA